MKTILYSVVVLVFFVSCNQNTQNITEIVAKPKVNRAICLLYPTTGNNVTGIVEFTREGNGIRVVANVNGLSPGKHGFHIHQYGDCSSSDAESAGGHFNPRDMQHGAPMDSIRHVGDFGNIEADSAGQAMISLVDTLISFDGINSIIGHAMIVHANEDDLTTQPTGNAGARLACGVIGIRGD